MTRAKQYLSARGKNGIAGYRLLGLGDDLLYALHGHAHFAKNCARRSQHAVALDDLLKIHRERFFRTPNGLQKAI
jgi:hypothetical protein